MSKSGYYSSSVTNPIIPMKDFMSLYPEIFSLVFCAVKNTTAELKTEFTQVISKANEQKLKFIKDHFLSNIIYYADIFNEITASPWVPRQTNTKIKELISFVLDANIDVNAVDEEGRSALHIASALGNVESVKALIKAGADVNLQDKLGRTPLHFTVMRQELVKKILKEPINNPLISKNIIFKIEKYLTNLCKEGQIKVLEELLRTECIDLEVKNKIGNTVEMLINRDIEEGVPLDKVTAREFKNVLDNHKAQKSSDKTASHSMRYKEDVKDELNEAIKGLKI